VPRSASSSLPSSRPGSGCGESNAASIPRLIGETQTFVSKCERGERRIDVIELRTFCQAFGLTLKQFVGALERALGKGKSR